MPPNFPEVAALAFTALITSRALTADVVSARMANYRYTRISGISRSLGPKLPQITEKARTTRFRTCDYVYSTYNIHIALLRKGKGKGKGKVHPRTGHEGPEGVQMYSATLPSTSALDGGWVVSTTPRPPYPRERPGNHCVGGWLDPRAHLDGCGKSRPNRDSISGPSSP